MFFKDHHFKRYRKYALLAVMVLGVLFFAVAPSKKSYAPNPCSMCNPVDCVQTYFTIISDHLEGRRQITDYITNAFVTYRLWLYNEFFVNNLLHAMMKMTEQLSAVGMHQMLAVGTMVDAKIQLEAQRDIQHLQWKAIKDYQPSEDFCWLGTNVRSVSASEHIGQYHKMAMNKISMTRHMGTWNSPSGMSRTTDKKSRWDLFVQDNCMVFNNNWDHDNPTFSGLEPLCSSSADSERANADIHYSRFVDPVRTLDRVDRSGGAPTVDSLNLLNAAASNIERDVIAMARNLYGHDTPTRNIGYVTKDTVQHYYNSLRSVTAKRNVAENSFNSIVGLKTPGTSSTAPVNTKEFMAAIMRDLGVNTTIEDIEDLIGEDPSFMAQMEVLAKRIYQDQSFYANLYDKPENVQRVSVAMEAIELMLDRAMYESRLRKEMAVSVLLSTKLNDVYGTVQDTLESNLDKK